MIIGFGDNEDDYHECLKDSSVFFYNKQENQLFCQVILRITHDHIVTPDSSSIPTLLLCIHTLTWLPKISTYFLLQI